MPSGIKGMMARGTIGIASTVFYSQVLQPLPGDQIGSMSLCGERIALSGIVALMAQKDPALIAEDAEKILESSALPLPPGSVTVTNPDGTSQSESWCSDATGAGLAQADAALAETPSQAP